MKHHATIARRLEAYGKGDRFGNLQKLNYDNA